MLRQKEECCLVEFCAPMWIAGVTSDFDGVVFCACVFECYVALSGVVWFGELCWAMSSCAMVIVAG